MASELGIRVPDQLEHLIDDQFRAVHKDWQGVSHDDVLYHMPELVETSYDNVVVIDPVDGNERDEEHTVVLALPHQQAWKPSMFVRAAYLQDQVAPRARMIVMPNNTVGDSYYKFSGYEKDELYAGRMRAFFEHQTKVLEELDVRGRVDLTGYSLGALTALGIASINSDKFYPQIVNADEAPNVRREPGALQKDFMNSGGWGEQQDAIDDSNVPVLRDVLTTPKLAADYARFGLATLLPENRALHHAMAGNDFEGLLARVFETHPAVAVKIGNVIGSRVFQAGRTDAHVKDLRANGANISRATYSGEGARLHPTGDNIVAHALMFKHAVELSRARAA